MSFTFLGKMLANMREPPDIDRRIKREMGIHMRSSVLIVALAALAACSGEDAGEATGEDSAGGGGDYRALAECSARMDAVSALYGAIAEAPSGDSAGEMRNTAELRAAAAQVLKAEAEKVSGDAAAVETVIAETKASIDAEQEKQEFQQFGAWLGKEADGCAPLVQAIVKGE
jgi:hypothetical protein